VRASVFFHRYVLRVHTPQGDDPSAVLLAVSVLSSVAVACMRSPNNRCSCHACNRLVLLYLDPSHPLVISSCNSSMMANRIYAPSSLSGFTSKFSTLPSRPAGRRIAASRSNVMVCPCARWRLGRDIHCELSARAHHLHC